MEKPTLWSDHPVQPRKSISVRSEAVNCACTSQLKACDVFLRATAWPWTVVCTALLFFLVSSASGALAQSKDPRVPRRCNSINTTAPTEVAALLGILQGFSNSTGLPGWGGQGDPCGAGGDVGFGVVGSGWTGVICQNASASTDAKCTTTVSGLQLTDANIEGFLSSTIEDLRNLATLKITGNPGLRGPIPAALGNLSWLSILDLHGNAFTGNIPTFSNLTRLQFLDLSGNQINGTIPGWLGNLKQLQRLDLSSNQLSGSLPVSSADNATGLNNLTFALQMSFSNNNLTGSLDELSALQNLGTLNGSHNRFNGPFPVRLLQTTNASKLAVLDLSSNGIAGSLPDVSILGLREIYVAKNEISGSLPPGFLNSSSLQVLNLDGNNISGTLNLQALRNPSALQMLSLANNSVADVVFPVATNLQSAPNRSPLNNLFLGGNPYCNDPQTDLLLQICRSDANHVLTKRVSASSKSKKNSSLLVIIIIVVVVGIVVLLAFSLSLFLIRRLTNRVHALHSIRQESAKSAGVQPYLYSYSELRVATQDFSSDMRLGQGGFGAVYKGVLSGAAVVAVKQLNNADQGLAAFLNEVVTLSHVRHPNLVWLKGCCVTSDQRLLVSEYVENKNLADALWDAPSKGDQELDWTARFNIVLGVARGLAHLHEEVSPAIIHRDIKAANILLGKDLNPKIGDFGLALLFPTLDEDRTQLCTNIAGTKGYLSPEYASLGEVSEKVDVFSFGILVLEIISGRKNINLRLPAEQRYILEWAWKLYEADTLSDFIDANLVDKSKEDIKQVIKLGLSCVQYSAARRPTMSDVVSVLLGHKQLDSINADSELCKGEIESMFETLQTGSLTPVDEDSPLLVGLPTASASGAFIELGKLKPR